jgi:hypothetical protein
VTLVELVVALAILGVTLAMAGLGVRSLEPPPGSRVARAIDAARERAILTGAPTVYALDGRAVRFAADGSATGGPIVADSLVFLVDPLTGAVHAVAR